MSMHKCPREGCDMRLPSSTLACKKHWFMVSAQTRRDLQEAWRSGDLQEYVILRATAIREMNHT